MKRGLMHCWSAAYEDAVREAFVKAGVNLDYFKYPVSDYNNDENVIHAVENYFKKYADAGSPCEFVFSVNYIPVLSKVCQRTGVRYISWSVDSPLATIYSKTITNPCNYFFTFDKVQAEESEYYRCIYKETGRGSDKSWGASRLAYAAWHGNEGASKTAGI